MALAAARQADPGGGRRRALCAAGRLVGFALTAGLALSVLAAVVLLPSYADTLAAQYQRDLAKARLTEMQALVVGADRLIAAAEADDPVLTRRLAMNHLGLRPAQETVADADRKTGPGRLLHVPPGPWPKPPSRWLTAAAAKLRRPNIRRGLLLLAGAAMLVALLAFSAPRKYVQRRTDLHCR